MSTAHTEAAPSKAAPRARSGRRPAQLWHYLGLAFIIFWGLAPFYWMVVTALRDSDHTFDTTPWPTHVTLDNFADALATDKGNDFVGAIVNSLLISLATTGLAVAVGVFTAYAIARLEFPGKGFITGLILAASMFPAIALVTPLFQLFGDLEWIGTYRAMIIPNISFALPLTVYTLVSFFRQLPWELKKPRASTAHHAGKPSGWFSCRWQPRRYLPRRSSRLSPPGMNSCWHASCPTGRPSP